MWTGFQDPSLFFRKTFDLLRVLELDIANERSEYFLKHLQKFYRKYDEVLLKRVFQLVRRITHILVAVVQDINILQGCDMNFHKHTSLYSFRLYSLRKTQIICMKKHMLFY